MNKSIYLSAHSSDLNLFSFILTFSCFYCSFAVNFVSGYKIAAGKI